jgi:hypothetical protein
MKMATNGVGLEIEVAESQIRSGGRRLISNRPFIESHYPTRVSLAFLSMPHEIIRTLYVSGRGLGATLKWLFW